MLKCKDKKVHPCRYANLPVSHVGRPRITVKQFFATGQFVEHKILFLLQCIQLVKERVQWKEFGGNLSSLSVCIVINC
jgi:hypothetical protein